MTKGSSWNTMEITKDRIWEHQEGRTTEWVRI